MTRGSAILGTGAAIVMMIALAIAGCSDGGNDGPTAPPDPFAGQSSGSAGSSGGTNQVEFANIVIEKATNGVDADFEPGPSIPENSKVTWTYRVTNNGDERLTNIVVLDDPQGPVACEFTSLDPQTFTDCGPLSGPAVLGQYSNTATVTAETDTGESVTESDPSHYFGISGDAQQIAIDVQKMTNGEDADSPTGPILLAAADPGPETVTWTYFVTNHSDPSLEVFITSAEDKDVNMVTTDIICPVEALPIGQPVECTSVSDTVMPGQYSNLFTVEAAANGETVTGSDRSHYFGALPEISLTKLTDGEDAPALVPGCEVTWSYEIENSGNVELEGIELMDDMEGEIACPSSELDAGDAMTCIRTGTVGDVEYENEATVSARYRVAEPNEVDAFDEDGYTIDGTPVCEQIVTSVDELWPPNHGLVDVDLADGVCDRTLDIRISGVTQDEPLNDTGDGNTEPDAFLVDDDTVQLRSERAGGGDGRVYLIQFEVFDTGGSSLCLGEARVDVPHDQGGSPAIDSRPPEYDSLD